ncbi:MAG: hypothetical protein PUC65_10785 [Clostridiales bacterium]|nr:hypothetical protein [Clostridiales bacterium]
MDTLQIISGSIMIVIAIACGVITVLGIRNRGSIFLNTYLWSTKEQRKRIDKKAEYKLQSIIFGGLTLIFVFISIGIFTRIVIMQYISAVLAGIICIYAIYDGTKNMKKREEYWK